MVDTERRIQIEKQFDDLYQAAPQLWSRAPGRVDLMGSHTDYNMGYVMTMTVDRDTWIAARPRADRRVCIASGNRAGTACFDLDREIVPDSEVPWSNYVRGIAWVLQEAGYSLQGFDGFVHSTVPFGSGLSSSAALEMATVVTFQQAGGFELDPLQMALLGQKAENDFVGVSTGILDQYSSAMGRAGSALLLDCRSLTSDNVRIAAGLQVVICDTRAARNLVGSEYDDRRRQCEEGARFFQRSDPAVQSLRDVTMAQFAAREADLPPIVAKRCRFILEENRRVLDLAPALSAGDGETLHKLFVASYEGARDLFQIGAPSMAAMMRAMAGGPGVVAARQAGAGFGGCMVALVRKDQVDSFREHVQQVYTAESGIQPRTFAVVASPGAGKVASFSV